MKAQTATAKLDTLTTCPVDTVLVPLNVTNFIDIGAMSIYIHFDTNTTTFISLQNISPLLTSGLAVNVFNSQVAIAYSSLTPFTLNSGLLFDLKFVYLSDSTDLDFTPETEIANSNLETLPLNTYNGKIYSGISIIQQPDSVQAYPDSDVSFSVMASGNDAFLWQENSGSGWTDLSNSATYTGVNTSVLTIHSVPLGFSGNLYRCILSLGDCQEFSGIGLLEVNTAYPVATLGQISSCPETEVLEPLFAGDFYDVMQFTFNISFDTNSLHYISLQNIYPDLLSGTISVETLSGNPGITIHYTNTQAINIISGKLFDISLDYSGQNQSFDFVSGTQVLNSQLNPINITLTNGQLIEYPLPVITQQAQNTTVTEGFDAYFSVLSADASSFQWFESQDDGATWTILTNFNPYYNTNTDQLTISPVSLSMDAYRYKCQIWNDNCNIFSDEAVLYVDSVVGIQEINKGKAEIDLSPNPLNDYINVRLTNFAEGEINITFYNSLGIKVFEINQLNPVAIESQTLRFYLPELVPGIYICRINQKYGNEESVFRKKFIKSQ